MAKAPFVSRLQETGPKLSMNFYARTNDGLRELFFNQHD